MTGPNRARQLLQQAQEAAARFALPEGWRVAVSEYGGGRYQPGILIEMMPHPPGDGRAHIVTWWRAAQEAFSFDAELVMMMLEIETGDDTEGVFGAPETG